MERRTLALVAIGAGSWLWWYPVVASRELVPLWAPLVFIAVLIATATLLFPKERFAIVTTVTLCTFLGDYSGYFLWQPLDGVSASFVPLVVAGATIAVLLVALLITLLVYKPAPSDGMRRRSLWGVLWSCVAIGVIAASATPVAMRYRAVQNDRVAAARFLALKEAAERTVAEGRPACDGGVLQRHYSGPNFSSKDWNQVINNAVFEDGYSFTVFCRRDDGGYAIEVAPVRDHVDGTRRFCTDESKITGCRVERIQSQYRCLPCS